MDGCREGGRDGETESYITIVGWTNVKKVGMDEQEGQMEGHENGRLGQGVNRLMDRWTRDVRRDR